MRRCSGRANELRYRNTIRGTPRGIAVNEREIDSTRRIKIKIIYIFVETVSLLMEKFLSKNAASVSEAFALFS